MKFSYYLGFLLFLSIFFRNFGAINNPTDRKSNNNKGTTINILISNDLSFGFAET